MRTTVHALSAFALLATAPLRAQTFTTNDVAYWVGTGSDSTVLVIDFQDGSDDASYAWGFLHDGTATAEDMLNAVAAADVNLSVDIPGGFLNSVTYGEHAGIGGDPDWWSTWSGSSLATMVSNLGIAEVLSNGSWFGCSYTDFDPALQPTEPIAAYDPLAFTADDVLFWTGSGAQHALLVIDFQDGSATPSYAWGYRFDGSTTGEAMLNAVVAADPALAAVVTTGFLSDVSYGTHAGIGGAPDWWSTWSATNLGNWTSNLGLTTAVEDGGLFGCSYTDFAPALRPSPPVAAEPATSIHESNTGPSISVFPQPARDILHVVRNDRSVVIARVLDLAGQVVHEQAMQGPTTTIDVSRLPTGMYVLQVGQVKRTLAVQ